MTNNRNHLANEVSKRGSAVPGYVEGNFSNLYGSLVFSRKEMRQRLPKSIFKEFESCINQNKGLSVAIADVVAACMKDWAIENGASHYSHLFQPMTGSTAEKHDTFIQPTDEGHLIMSFSGKELIQGEPDASSFPSGGLRATFEARGYTAWDPTSPAFLKKNNFGATLYIPTAFCSYTGEALDMKTPLMRSRSVIGKSAIRLLDMLGHKTQRVYTTSGLEQEYFLIDKTFYHQRPDLIACGRTLFGKMPYKGQELDDHYFGAIRSRVLNFMMEAEHELYKLGIPVKTRHNEVAPGQFEVAPTFEEANLAVDHNLMIMDVMAQVADKHNLKMLIHEKPFAEINGSGKHCNWSLSDAEGNNLLDPGDTPQENLQFMIFLSAVIRGIDKYSKLLRISVAHAGNDHRLGANEAPPAIISIFLGTALEEIVDSIVAGRDASTFKQVDMELGVGTLPKFPKDNTDRNRTSPFAFTGNKFEFRALGSAQSGSVPNYFLNTIVADSLEYISDALESKLNDGIELRTAINSIIKSIFTDHKRVIFNGNGYSKEWEEEAARRGLPNLKTTVDAIEHFDDEEHVSLFLKYGVLSKTELQSRKNVRMEKYNKTLEIELRACLDIVSTIIIPSVIQYKYKLATVVEKLGNIFGEKDTIERKELKITTDNLRELYDAKNQLTSLIDAMPADEMDRARYIKNTLIPAMLEVRKYADILEGMVDDSSWPLPKYREMLSIL